MPKLIYLNMISQKVIGVKVYDHDREDYIYHVLAGTDQLHGVAEAFTIFQLTNAGLQYKDLEIWVYVETVQRDLLQQGNPMRNEFLEWTWKFPEGYKIELIHFIVDRWMNMRPLEVFQNDTWDPICPSHRKIIKEQTADILYQGWSNYEMQDD